ncbi:HNH endonuclease signature motif containing protein [Pseudonocardia phyllosphaerae]|uniref:HNH endonuclease signature motif containing protein n=1 Tax=Pseudonocardia phyllosphaerae TaxID=3390502 RepID=UPI0039785DCD
MTERVTTACDRIAAAVDALADTLTTATGTEICAVQLAVESLQRRLDQVAVRAVAKAEREDLYAARGYRSTAGALADLLRWDPRHSRRFTTAAQQLAPRTTLDGQPLDPTLPATAQVFAGGEISLRHAEVVATLLDSAEAGRLDPAVWAGAEIQLAAQAVLCTPAELQTWGRQLLADLDQDGPEPDDRPEPRINELRLTTHRGGRPGGILRGRFDDAEMFERIRTAVDALTGPGHPDDPRSHPERQAEALAEICGYGLEHAGGELLPDTGGQRPQVTVTVRLEDLQNRARAALLDHTGGLSASALRMLCCDAAVIPVVLDGAGQPLDVGRARRTIPRAIRRAVAARDRGCAHPGCDRPPSWCEIHHIIAWEIGGPTAVTNLVMLCRVHHGQVHHAGWTVRLTDGIPEFLPPAWIDPRQQPRRRPNLNQAPITVPAPRPPADTETPARETEAPPVAERELRRVIPFEEITPPDPAPTYRVFDFDRVEQACREGAPRRTVRVANFSGLEEDQDEPPDQR